MKIMILLVGIIMLAVSDANATFYNYKDSSGVVVITDDLESIPQKYRKQYKVVWEKDLEAKDPLAKRKAASKAIHEQQEQERQKQKAAEKKLKPSDGKTLVITVDEETGQIIRRME